MLSRLGKLWVSRRNCTRRGKDHDVGGHASRRSFPHVEHGRGTNSCLGRVLESGVGRGASRRFNLGASGMLGSSEHSDSPLATANFAI